MPFDLVCTKCNKKLAQGLADDMVQFMVACYCNDQTCQGKLEFVKI